MNLIKQILLLVKKDIIVEWRQRHAIGSVLLYVFSTIVVVYMASAQPRGEVWNTLFWVIFLFVSLNASNNSFDEENSRRQLYYYTLVDGDAILWSKMVYNFIVMVVLAGLTWLGFGIISGGEVRDPYLFAKALISAALGFSVIFTFVGAIASKAKNSATMVAILGMPLVIPILLILLKVSAQALGLLNDTNVADDLWLILGMDLALMATAILLFPYLWRD